jgi:hypothetical protein
MLAYGQPLHAFNRAKVGQAMTIRRTRKGDKISRLDTERHEANGEMLICNENRPMAYSRLPRSNMATFQISLQNIFSPILKNLELLLQEVMTAGSKSAELCTRGKPLQRILMTATIRLARLLVHKAYRKGFELAT